MKLLKGNLNEGQGQNNSSYLHDFKYTKEFSKNTENPRLKFLKIDNKSSEVLFEIDKFPNI